MVNPLSGWVLVGAALVSSPAWHAALVTGTLTLETAATRFGIALVVVWVGLSMVGSLVRGTSPAPERSDPSPHDGPLPARPAEIDPASGA